MKMLLFGNPSQKTNNEFIANRPLTDVGFGVRKNHLAEEKSR
jgi:hypothetical protein